VEEGVGRDDGDIK